MDRVTMEVLRSSLDRINKKLKTTEDNKLVFYIAYGKIQLCQNVEGSSGIRNLSLMVTKREMYYILDAMENTLYRFIK